jgi:hypothetical protein
MAMVRSSNGNITIDEEGNVTNTEIIEGGELPDIRKFDLVRYWNEVDSTEKEDFDILELGFWYAPEPPNDEQLEYVEPDANFINRVRLNL